MIAELVVKFDESGDRGVLFKPLWCFVGGKLLKIPAGFRTDFASVPRGVRSLIPQLGRWTSGAVVHDALYWCGPSWGFTQKEADKTFLQIMADSKVGWFRMNAIYMALRMFGRFAWNEHRNAGHCADNMVQEVV